jgi:signal transduction histidine kinase
MSVASEVPQRRVAPRSWLQLPPRTARLRLTLLYAGLFFVLGTCMLVLVYLVGSHSSSASIDAKAVPFGAPLIPQPKDIALAQQSNDRGALLAASWLALGLTTVASGVLGWFAAGRVLRPVRTITETARTISAGNLHQRLALTGPNDEFKRLGDTLDQLLARLEASFEAQRRFVANASHELRTPLTFERTRLQVALADPDASSESLRAACEEVLASEADQERLLESLLTLAVSERGLEHAETVDLRAVVADELREPRPGIERLSLRIEDQLEAATLAGDSALVRRLVANLLDNAVQHNVPGGSVLVVVRTAGDGGGAQLSVTNSGVVIDPGEVQRLLEPFQRLGVRGTGPPDGEGYGLGLSIVRAITRAHGASLDARAQPKGGLAVTVTWPPA